MEAINNFFRLSRAEQDIAKMEFKIIYFTFMVVFALASLVEYSTADSTSQHEGISLATFNTELVPLYVTGENVMENLFERAHKIMKLVRLFFIFSLWDILIVLHVIYFI